ncbi:hypothetical protein [Microcoleus asticus]|nr:hypothetical protein [Microcoleus asticus]
MQNSLLLWLRLARVDREQRSRSIGNVNGQLPTVNCQLSTVN